MVANFGFFLLFLALNLSIYGFFASFLSVRLKHYKLFLSAKHALHAVSLLTVGASMILVALFVLRDYSAFYVYKHSSNDLPLFYTITAFWASLEGSHLLWTLLLTLCGSLSVKVYAAENKQLIPFVLGIYHLVMVWMLYMAITHSDPFIVNLPKPENGTGMNELLQNPLMAVHPPLLFMGYAALVVPFAYGLATLFYGDIPVGFLKSIRRWTLFAWILLTASIALGGVWAYVELGWGGYWAWDPVENSSFLPWLVVTALIHTLILQEKFDDFKKLSIILCLIGFFLTFFGTFLTRSGIISSVHSFADSTIGPNYLIFLSLVAVLSLILYGLRAYIIPSGTNKNFSGISKEFFMVMGLFILFAFFVIVFIGTVFPLLSEVMMSEKISIQAPYFNTFAPYVGFLLALGIAVSVLLPYGEPRLTNIGIRVAIAAAVISLLLTGVIYFQIAHSSVEPLEIIGYSLSLFVLASLVGGLFLKLKNIGFRIGGLFHYRLAYVGSFVAHCGFVVMVIGLLGNYRKVETDLVLEVGKPVVFADYQFQMVKNVTPSHVDNHILYSLPIEVKKGGELVSRMTPSQSLYFTNREQTFNEVAVSSNLWHDIYLVLKSWDEPSRSRATVSIYINPGVMLVWIAVILMILGGAISLFDVHKNRVRWKV